MSRVLTTFTVLATLATGSAIVLGIAAETLLWPQFWPDLVRAMAVVSGIVGALVWCTERICRDMAKHQKQTLKQLRAIERLGRERIEAAHQMQDALAERRRINDR